MKIFSKKWWEIGLVGLILILAASVRLYRIEDYMMFLGDEGRDARVVAKILTGDMTFIGPMTSVTTSQGHMFLGPGYYYMMAPFMALFEGSPVGAAVMVAILSVATVGLIWWVGRSWFAPIAGLVAALLYSLSPITIIFGRASWNPNVMPFFAMLAIWGGVEALKGKGKKWWLMSAIGLAGGLPSQFLGLLMVSVLGGVGGVLMQKKKK